MNTPHQDTPTEATDDMLRFGLAHADVLTGATCPVRAARAAAKRDCIYAQAHDIRVAYVNARVQAAGV